MKYAVQEMDKLPCQRCILLRVKGAEKGVTPIGRYIHKETPCATCVPLFLLPINEEPFQTFILCRNALLRDAEGKPYDLDINAIAAVVNALQYRQETLIMAVNLMRHLLQEEKL